MKLEEYIQFDAVALADLVRTKQISAKELLETALSAADRIDPQLNAIVHRLDERARQRSGYIEDGPFVGVPFLLKDTLEVANVPVSYGARLLARYVSKESHAIAHRLDDAGLQIFGRTNMSELGLLPTTECQLYGPTANPHNPEYSPGGSSGGSAAVVAGRIVPMAMASDGGGSIRIPASACGLFGLKPSRGRTPNVANEPQDAFVVHHCVSRSVRDSARLLDITTARTPTAGSRFFVPPPVESYEVLCQRSPRRPLRIAFSYEDYHGRRASDPCVEAVQKSAKLCESLGHQVSEGRPAIDAPLFEAAFKIIWSTAAGYFFRRAQRMLEQLSTLPRAIQRAAFHPTTLRALAAVNLPGTPTPLVEPVTRKLAAMEQRNTPADLWLAWSDVRSVEVALSEFFERYDIFLSPTLAHPPLRTGSIDQHWSVEKLEAFLNGYAAYTPLGNATGYPAMSLPLHCTSDGLPIGTHFFAPLGREDRLFQLAGQIERAAPWAAEIPQLVRSALGLRD
ncbi:MAG: amidase [Deltaproteobacteria bacterium]|nr:amidase [Deltaproteobacteria bacterium]